VAQTAHGAMAREQQGLMPLNEFTGLEKMRLKPV
jgi:hypothetical protein